ncbi:AAA family ATPase [Paenibacillus sp. BSR1-1]|uniref:ATP-binding protein n=1 Tax=Paenibacillus sp. BSR1-1 TaxID=3020845 RepID=UPI0025B216CD|nr:AAA family ATPase [Paenibacillus sp. BSR1-1]MDN3015166.1 AAA family ATPase [Paenibacillus sp. BSR1-1]
MKIVELQIYGYGQLENVKINDISEFQVFFGENEAGKSTIMAFIHGVLFGFPTKQQTELRYEPKHHHKYGGKIKVYHEEYGYAVIERVKGKAAGDVTVLIDNGKVGGEELLKEILLNFDKGLFQAIFSFSLQGLQNIHQMKGEEIGRFLFSAGTLGTEKLAKTESILQKELDFRFKPSGKKPIINEKLQELHEISAELKKAAAKNKDYELLVDKKEKLQQEMENVNHSLVEMHEEVEKLSEWKRIEAIVKEEKWTKKDLGELGEIAFPTRGIERIEKLTQLIHPYNAQIASLEERIIQIKNELENIQPEHSILENEAAILSSLDQVPLHDQLKLEKKQCETKLLEIEEKLAAIKERLHLNINEEEILSINTNIYMKNQVERVSRKQQKLEEAKEDLEAQFRDEKNNLQEIEKEIRLTESVCLPKQKRELLVEQVNQGNDKKSLETELKSIQDKFEFYQMALEREKNEKARFVKQRRFQFIIFDLILLAIAIYGLLTKQVNLLAFGCLGCLIITFFIIRGLNNSKQKTPDPMLTELKEKEKAILQKLQSAEIKDFSQLEEQLRLDNLRHEQLQKSKIKLEQQQKHYEKVITKFEEWELEAAQNKEQLFSISSELKIPEYIANTFLQEAFHLIEQYKSVLREKKQILERLEHINQQQAKIVKDLNIIANRYLPEKSVELQKTAYLVRNKLKEEHEKQIKSQERVSKLADLKAELQQKKQEQGHLQLEYQKLIDEAEVDSEQKYYELGEKAAKQGKLLERLESIQSQLHFSILSEPERDSYLQLQNGEELLIECNRQIQGLQAKLKNCQEELASIKYEIQALEEGGLYSDILHHYKQKKFELEETAKEWSVYSLAQDILVSTIERYKNIHLPRMISKAEGYLSFLTNGSYQKIHLQKSGTGFLVEREDHTLFEANELSQATTEQLYLAVRLALATTLYENYHFPIIIDDSFVNFDAGRTEKVIQLLNQLDGNQILFFTCHSHILHFFKKENVLRLEKGAVQIIS